MGDINKTMANLEEELSKCQESIDAAREHSDRILEMITDSRQSNNSIYFSV